MSKSILNSFGNWLQPPLLGLPKYGLLYFDHLLGLYDVLAQKITDPTDKKILEDAKGKRERGGLEWKDIYSFDLVLLKYLGIEQLRSKLLTLRSQYRNIAGQKEYDAYVTSKPPDPISTSDEKVLRQDIEYLLNEFYLRYSLTSAREHLRSNLLKMAAIFTTLFLVVGAILIKLHSSQQLVKLFGFNPGITTTSVVIFAGIVGAFISMQQRIQSAPSEGDPIYNFSVLTHGAFGIFLSPVTGAIFAVILYLMFAAGILTGKAFPKINTVQAKAETKLEPAPAPESPAPSESSPSSAPAPESPAPSESSPSRPIMLAQFSEETGPASGVDYALLLIWAFVAGFAERFVPDALNRMVAKSEAEKGTTT